MWSAGDLFIFIVAFTFGLCSCTTKDHAPGAARVGLAPDSVLNAQADSLSRVGLALTKQRLTDSALAFQERALSLRLSCRTHDVRLAYGYWRAARLLSALENHDAAEKKIATAIKLAEEYSAPRDSLIRMVILAANLKAILTDDASAISLAQYAEHLANQPPVKPMLLRDCMALLGVVHNRAGRFDKSIAIHWRLIPLLDPASEKVQMATMYFNIAMGHWSMERYDSCLVNLDKTLALRIIIDGTISPMISSILLNKGDVFRHKNMYDSARSYWQRCLTMRRTLYGDKHFQTAGAYEAMGELYSSIGNIDSALFYRQALLRSQIRSFNETDISRNPHPLEEEINLDLVDYLVDKGTTVRVAAKRSLDPALLDISLSTYLLADSVYVAFQDKLPYEDLKLNLMEAGRIPYDDMLEVAFLLFNTTKDKRYLQLAHNIMEHSRAVILKNAIGRADSFEDLGLPQAILNREKILLMRRNDLLRYLKDNVLGETKRDSLGKAIINVDRDYERLKVAIADEQPGYLHMRYGKDIRLDRLSWLMAQKQSLWIQYYWAPDSIYVLTIGATQSQLRAIPVSAEILGCVETVGKEVSRFSDESISHQSFDRYTKAAHSLFKTLVAPSLEGQTVQKLVISPSGPLMSFPFEALVTRLPSFTETDFRLEYLVSEHDISYQYSSSFLDREYARTRHGDKMLAIGHAASDPAFDTESDLPGAREEIAVVRNIMANRANRYLLQEEASEHEFKAHAEQFNLLHLAVHGVADTINAMESHLVFRTGGGSEDGKLFARELYTMDLRHADLAVLSACETGVGRVQTGEGIMSIARGFAYAGCPSMVVSLWKVSDKSAPLLMASFYEAISSSASIDAALADAKRSYLQHTNMFNSHPSFWAAFLAVGETAAVVKSNHEMIAVLSVVLLIAALLTVWRFVINRKASRLQLKSRETDFLQTGR
jgi:CHAT domain-containing protein